MNVIGHRWHRCDRFSQIVANYHLSVSIGIVYVISGQFFMFIFVVSENSITFTPEFRRHSGGVRKDFIEKGVIEIIFDVQTSQL